MRASRSRRACESISAILTAHGNAAPTRTLTDCCASTSPKGPISACTAPTRLQPWPPPSTRGPERRLIGRHPQRRLTGFSYQPTKIVLRRPLESALAALVAVEDVRLATLGQGLLQRLDAEVGFHRDRHPMRENPPAEHVDDRRQVDETAAGSTPMQIMIASGGPRWT